MYYLSVYMNYKFDINVYIYYDISLDKCYDD